MAFRGDGEKKDSFGLSKLLIYSLFVFGRQNILMELPVYVFFELAT